MGLRERQMEVPFHGACGSSECKDLPMKLYAGRMSQDRLKNILDGNVAALKATRLDRAAVEHKTWHIQADQSHRRAGNRLIAAHKGHDGIEHVCPTHQFN